MLHQIGVFTRAGACVSLMCACAHNIIVPMLLLTISAVVWCGSWHASDWNSLYCLFQAGIQTNISTHRSHSSYFAFCPCVCMRLCIYSPFMSAFVCVCVQVRSRLPGRVLPPQGPLSPWILPEWRELLCVHVSGGACAQQRHLHLPPWFHRTALPNSPELHVLPPQPLCQQGYLYPAALWWVQVRVHQRMDRWDIKLPSWCC